MSSILQIYVEIFPEIRKLNDQILSISPAFLVIFLERYQNL